MRPALSKPNASVRCRRRLSNCALPETFPTGGSSHRPCHAFHALSTVSVEPRSQNLLERFEFIDGFSNPATDIFLVSPINRQAPTSFKVGKEQEGWTFARIARSAGTAEFAMAFQIEATDGNQRFPKAVNVSSAAMINVAR